MGSCITRDRIDQIDADLQMLNSENRIRNDNLLREILVIKQMLNPEIFHENKRYSCYPVQRTAIKYI